MPAKAKQLGFSILEMSSKRKFGGGLLKKSHAKTARPITTKRPMHLVLRSSLAKGALSFMRRDQAIYGLIDRQAKLHGVKLYSYANGGNHVHLLIQPTSRKSFNGFVRSASGLIARLVLGVQRGSSKGIKFWDQRPYSDIVEWGRHFARVSEYLKRNTLEAYGFIRYTPRGEQLRTSSA